MDDLLNAQDIAAILSEAWDSTPRPGVTRARAERLLKRLLELPGKDPNAKDWSEYFSARHKMLGGDLAGARAAFERIAAASGKQTGFPYRGYRWRHYLTVRQAALLESGRIADLQLRREDALGHYKQLLSSITVPAYSEDYHNDYLLIAKAYDAIRGLTQVPYSKTLEVEKSAASFQSEVFRESTESSGELKKALELSRTGKWLEAAILVEDVLKQGKASPDERCEGYIIAASAYARDKKTAAARRHLQSFDAECGDISAESWLLQRRKQLEEVLK